VTPIRQQNPPEPLKLLGLREKTGKNTDFDFAQITLNILVYQCTSLCELYYIYFKRGSVPPRCPLGSAVLVQFFLRNGSN
jgi:hypothetical protein